jgi:hypothetical protein
MNDSTASATAALLFIASATNALDVFSAVNSSPWTAYNFANDEDAQKALRYYVMHAIIITGATNVTGAIIAKRWWPILGATIASVYMWWLYEDAVSKGEADGTENFQK